MDKTTIGTLQVIFKIVERCNLNCSYCYYYSGADLKTDLRPSVVSKNTISAIADFLRQGCSDYAIGNLSIIFHGGEPTLMKHGLFDWMCDHLRTELSGLTNVTFSMQTNAVHLSDEWIGVLSKHGVSVGVSIDGSKEYNDRYRVDHKGNGSHDRIYGNVKKLNLAADKGLIRPIGLVCVLNKAYDYSEIYSHFTRELGIGYLNFLLPDRNRDTPDEGAADVGRYGDVLCELFDEWLDSGLDSVEVRQFSELLKNFSGRLEVRQAPANYVRNQIVVIHSDGDIAVDDSLMPAMEWYQSAATANVAGASMRDWFSQPMFNDLRQARETLPDECAGCRWSTLCHGGDVENRFSKADGFSGRSIYCSALKKFYEHATRTLVDGGYPQAMLESAIRGEHGQGAEKVA